MIASGKVRLVRFAEKHLERSFEWFNDEHLSALLNRTSRITYEQHISWFESLSRRVDTNYFAVEHGDDGVHVGNVWLADIDRRNSKAELRIIIGDSSSRNRGIGSQAIDLLCRYAFESLALHRIYSYVLATNPRAKRSFEKAGFVVEGILSEDRLVNGDYVDSFLLGRLSPHRPGVTPVPIQLMQRG